MKFLMKMKVLWNFFFSCYFVDLLNDCLDQIDDFLDGQINYDEDKVVEFLRSNDYNVEEAIDFIMDNCVSVVTPIAQPVPTVKATKPVITQSSFTLPPSISH